MTSSMACGVKGAAGLVAGRFSFSRFSMGCRLEGAACLAPG